MIAPTIITVPATEYWFRTGFQLAQGAGYEITVPLGQIWTDWWVKSGPGGGASLLQRPLRPFLRFGPDRDPRADFFTLIGTIGESLEHAFVIGDGPCHFQAAVTGELVCFANDLREFYWNNYGEMRLTIVRI